MGIKFRAWDKKNKCWSYDELYINEDGNVYEKVETSFGMERYDELNNVTDDVEISWYTGLKDKNGKEIYEGDIIHSLSPFHTGEGTIHDYDDDYYKVDWYEDDAKFHLTTNEGLNADFSELIEPNIVGNIYENLELSELKKE